MIALGVTDITMPVSELAARGASWTRIITTSQADVDSIAQRIREAHAAGLRVVLTVGGLGTEDRRPSFARALAFVERLPRTEHVTIDNEPDLDGVKPCIYRRGWMRARRVLGRRLLWGDLSPHAPQTFTQAARACGTLPKVLHIAIHPYQLTDPLAPPTDPAWAEGGLGALKKAAIWIHAATGSRVRWAITEIGLPTYLGDGPTGVTPEYSAWWWPRARKRAGDVGAEFLIAYVAHGATWRTESPDVPSPG